MSATPSDNYRLPACVSSIERRPRPGSPFTAFLVGREIGIADSERAAYDVLNYLHGVVRLDGVFINLDASHQFVGIDARYWWKGDFRRFRAFPNKRITAKVALGILADAGMCAASAFGITSEPPVYVQAFDDFHAWVTSEDHLRSLSGAAGGIEAVAALLESLSGVVDTDAARLELLLSLVRLRWSGAEWLQRQTVVDTLDPTQLLSPLGMVDGPTLARSVELIGDCKTRAAEFYRCCQARVAAFITKTVRQVRRERFTRAALLVDHSWFDHAAELLAAEGVAVVELRTTAGSGGALLDRARVLLNAVRGSVQLNDLFSGKDRPRTRIQALQEEETDTTDTRCSRWILAAHGLHLEYQDTFKRTCLEQAMRCIDRALEINPSNAEACSSKASFLHSQNAKADWQPWLRRAMDLEPMNEMHLLRLGYILSREGAHRHAARAVIRGLYRDPYNGPLWNLLGATLWNLDRHAAARYCFHKAADLGDPFGAQHVKSLCPGAPPSALVGPWSVSPPVIWLMKQLVLPLHYRFGQNWHLALQLLTLAAAAAAGVVVGGTAAGNWGGLAGALAYTGACAALVRGTRHGVDAIASVGQKAAERFDDLGEGGRRSRDRFGMSVLLPVNRQTKTLIGVPVVLVLALAGSAFAAWADERSRGLLASTAWEEVWSVVVRPLNFTLGCLVAGLLLTRLARWLMPRSHARPRAARPARICAYCKKWSGGDLLHLQRHNLLVEPDCFARYAHLPAQQWSAPGKDGEACTLCLKSDCGVTVTTPIGRICAKCTGSLLDLVARQCTDLSGRSVEQMMGDLLPTGELRAKLAVIKQLDKVRARLKRQPSNLEGELLKQLVACMDYDEGHPLDVAVRQSAQEAVIGTGHAALPALLAAARAESWQLRAHVVRALGRIAPDDPAVRDILRMAARDARSEVRRDAVRVALCQPAEWARELVRSLHGDSDPEVRAMVLPALTLLGDQT